MRILDLFCGAGGCSVGYHRAGFDVVGVDLHPQPNYPFEFVQADAVEWLRLALHSWAPASDGVAMDGSTRPLGCYVIEDFDAIHASPPCQAFSAYRRKGHGVGDTALNLIPETRRLLRATGLPYVIENVPGAPLENPVQLCGSSFDLDVRRHRWFDTNWPLLVPPCDHSWQTPRFQQATNRANKRSTVEIGVWRIPLETQQRAMGIDWMTLPELSQAIPPAFTEAIGLQLATYLARQDASASVPDPDAEVPACPSPSSPPPTSMRVTRASTTAKTTRSTLRGASSPASSSASPAS